jgi:hypothetical protein
MTDLETDLLIARAEIERLQAQLAAKDAEIERLEKEKQAEFEIATGYYNKWQKSAAEAQRLREAERWRELEVEPCGDIGTKALLYGIGGIDEGEYLGVGEWQVAYGSCPGETFTHWMPLPAAPKGDKDE